MEDRDDKRDEADEPGDGEDIKATKSQDDREDSRDLSSELEEQKKRNLYLRADFDNYRKQVIRERSDLMKYGSEPVLREILGVLDNLERAAHTELTPETMEKYKSGIEMIISQFKKTLERFGVEEIDSYGQPFDPNLHEALSSEENPEMPSGAITQVFKKAYKLHGKVIRPGQVVVNTGKKED